MFHAEYNTDEYIRNTFFQDYSYKGIMVEVGAGPTDFLSMSKHFRDSGWRCVCVEPNPKFVEQHRLLGNEIYQYACSFEEKETTFTIVDSTKLQGWSSEHDGISYSGLTVKYDYGDANFPTTIIPVTTIKLNTLLDQIGVHSVDFLSVDVEGYELEVVQGFDIEKYQTKVILLENYLNSQSYVDYMYSIGYQLHCSLAYNQIYTKR